MSRPYDKTTLDFESRFGALFDLVEQITDAPLVPNDQITRTKVFPFVTYNPLTLDTPVFGDPTLNDGAFEAVISFDYFSKTIAGMSASTDLRVYLRDRYSRQQLRNAGVVIGDSTAVQARSVDNLPLSGVYHYGFDQTVQYYRKYQSPIDRIQPNFRMSNSINKED